MISKELLSEVLNKTVGVVYTEDSQGNSFTNFVRPRFGDFVDEINIYELAHKCKEWATEYGYSIATGNRLDGTNKYDVLCIHKDEDIECSGAIFFNEIVDTEPEAIFKACQWILDNKDSHD